MACLSRLLHHPVLLVNDPYPRRLLALTQALSLLHPAAAMDRYVDRARFPYRAMAAHSALHRALDMDSCRCSFRNRHLDLLASSQTIQPCATRTACPKSCPDIVNNAWSPSASDPVSVILYILDTSVK